MGFAWKCVQGALRGSVNTRLSADKRDSRRSCHRGSIKGKQARCCIFGKLDRAPLKITGVVSFFGSALVTEPARYIADSFCHLRRSSNLSSKRVYCAPACPCRFAANDCRGAGSIQRSLVTYWLGCQGNFANSHGMDGVLVHRLVSAIRLAMSGQSQSLLDRDSCVGLLKESLTGSFGVRF